jgi:P27 family predicted phage terminase small subunit
MALRGRRPKPTALHELQGTLNATRHKHRALEPVAPGPALDAPPDWLSPSQQEGWRYAIAHAPKDLLKPIDRTVLLVWVEAEDRHRRACMAQAAIDGKNPAMQLVLPRSRGAGKGVELVESPYVRIITRAAETLMKAASELGFSPSARPRLVGPQPAAGTGPVDPWQRLRVLQGGKNPGAA